MSLVAPCPAAGLPVFFHFPPKQGLRALVMTAAAQEPQQAPVSQFLRCALAMPRTLVEA